MVESISVNLNERSYPIQFGRDLSLEIGSDMMGLKKAGSKLALITDINVATKQGEWLSTLFGDIPRCVVDAGEDTKSLEVFGRVLDFLAAQKLDRGGVLIAVGGGVIGDLGGYAAASYLRGIRFVQVPTTLLAMVDSSVGGKTGINLNSGKNLVGAFHQPLSVYIATQLLETLPSREFAAGMAEVVKYGLLGDAALFAQLEQSTLSMRSTKLPAIIRRCCEIKARIVEADERETAKDGGRALLNLGHTFGHAIERVAGYGNYLHGEAVAIGLAAAARLSQQLGYLDADAVARTGRVLSAHGLPVKLREPLSLTDLMNAMASDKKVRAGMPRFVVMKAIGDAATQGGIEPALAEACFREVGARD